MSQGQWIIAVFDVGSEADIVERAIGICRDVGFDVEQADDSMLPSGTYVLPITYRDYTTKLQFRQEDDREGEPIISFHKLVYPELGEDEDDEAIEAIFELICRFATELDGAYIPLFNSEQRSMEVVPDERPIPEAVETPPKLGVYSQEVLEGFGGVEGLFDHEPWYVADLERGHTLVIENESPWGEWRPPTDAPYIRSARFAEHEAETKTE